VRNLLKVKPRTPLLGASISGIPLQGASSSSTSTEREDLGHLVSGVDGLCGRGYEELIVASAYLPYDSDEPPPTKEVRDITEYCHSWKKQLIIGCNANAHHTLWGNTATNPRRESFVEFIVTSNLNILNNVNEPTFVVCSREVIDLTLGTNKIANLVIVMYLMSRLYQNTGTYAFE
jgi:hypothetical protein